MPPPRLNAAQLEAWVSGTKTADDAHRQAVDAAQSIDIESIPEYVVSGDATGKRLIIPVRALALGMAAWMRGER